MDLRSPARSIRSIVAVIAILTPSGPAAAQEWTTTSPHQAGMRTGTLLFPSPGVMIASLGVEYQPDVTNDLAGVTGELVRAPILGFKLGLSDQAVFQVSWPAYNRLRVHSQMDPPPLGRRLGRVSRDWGDLTVATLIRLHADQGGWPGTGVRFAAKLPNSNEKLGIGDNTTDVFASALLAKSFADRIGIYADVGLGILTARKMAFTQNDVLTYSVLANWRPRERISLLGEVSGQAATHDVGPGTVSRSELRAGLELARQRIHWSLLAVRGLSGWDSRGLGVSAHVSTSLAAFGRANPSR
jgi:hypothetical protein